MANSDSKYTEAELAGFRRVMGASMAGWAVPETPVYENLDGRFVFFSGVDAPDMNLALVHSGDVTDAEAVLAHADKVGKPALVLLAGQAAEKLATPFADRGFAKVGTYPFMRVEVAATSPKRDDRVREATAGDKEAVSAIMAAANGMAAPSVAVAVDPSLAPGGSAIKTWVLEQDGALVSCVQTAVVGDTVTVWCMSTPPDQQRKGYGSALLADVMARVAEDGAVYGLLGATPAGFPLYSKLGWEQVEEWAIMMQLPPAAAEGEAAE